MSAINYLEQSKDSLIQELLDRDHECMGLRNKVERLEADLASTKRKLKNALTSYGLPKDGKEQTAEQGGT